MGPVLAYMDQHAAITLRQGLADYFASNPWLKRGEALSAEAGEFFRSHDAVHVVYGCGASLADEAVVKLSSIFGSSAGIGVLRGYSLHDSIDIYRSLTLREILATLLAAPVLVPRTLFRCLAQRQRWPWSDFDRHLDARLCDLRAAYGIRTRRS